MIQTSPGCQASRPYISSVTRGADLEVAEEDRQPRRLPEHAVVGVEQRDRAVLQLVDDPRVRRADQRRVHLVGGGVERVADHLGGDRVDGGRWPSGLLSDRDDERAVAVDRERAARRHDGGRGGLLDDDAGPRAGAGAELVARRRPRSAAREPVEDARRGRAPAGAARRRRAPRARRGRGRRARRPGRRRTRPARPGSSGRSGSRAPR